MHKAIETCVHSLIFLTRASDFPAVPRMSTVKEVVSAVSAEPPAAKEQDTRPMMNIIPAITGSIPLVATAGNNSSPPDWMENRPAKR